ncbi:MAG TPA: 16S rRNA (uracil(1498)-N(3))-methyltransferase, partial [Thermodesulfobacteriota bacterium]
MPRRIIVPGKVNKDATISLKGELFSALRKREPFPGEIITVQDASGKAFRGRIVELKDDQARVFIFEEMTGPAESPFDLLLFQALPEKERMELIIQKATELGASVICPFKSRHSISLEEREATQPKTHRWQHIALKAAKQCRRASVPVVAPYCSFAQALEMARELDFKIILWEKEGTRLASLIRDMPPPRSIAVMVGPEGGWAEEEIQQARQEGF